MRKLHFLAAADGTRLTKRFRMTDEGLTKEPYPQVASFISHEEDVETIDDFLVALAAHAENGYCLLKGQLDRTLVDESRAGHTRSDDPTDWLVLDNDHLHDLDPQQLMTVLGLGDVDYIVQYSASAGVVPGKRGYHIFVLLDRPWQPSDLKLVLRAWNLDHPQISRHLQLSRTNNSLRWPLDVSVCQNDKLIYIAPPLLGPGVQERLDGDRIGLVKGTLRAATLQSVATSDEALRARENDVINRLREPLGLAPKNLEYRLYQGVQVASNAGQAQVTGRKEERGFVYLNLNGGDSFGYYHPITAPEVLFNFKSEPNYAISEFLPDYYPQAIQKARQAQEAQQLAHERDDINLQSQRIQDAESNGGRLLQAFRDQKTDQYYVGWINPQERTHDLNQIGTKAKINELYAQHGYPKIEVIPSVDYRFEPANDALYDPKAGFVNRYTPSVYLRDAQCREDASLPPTIARVIRSALGGDQDVVEHFLNWLAVLFRYRMRTQTAWILQGTTGTGKGLLVQSIISPLVGERYCRIATIANLEEQFNGFAEDTILLFIDEVDTDQIKQMPKLMAKVKSWITNPTIPLRAMRSDLREVPNHLNVILASNQPNSMRIEANDRRFNVCHRQERKLLEPNESGERLLEQITEELPEFADYLMSRAADQALARKALDNEPKRLLREVTQTAIEEVANAFRAGDLNYFMESRPDSEGSANYYDGVAFHGTRVTIRKEYRSFIDDALDAAKTGAKHVISHLPLFAVFDLLVGDMPKTKAKLTSRLRHQNLHIQAHTKSGKSMRGLGVSWNATPAQLAEWGEAMALEAKESEGQKKALGLERTPRGHAKGDADGCAA